MTCSAVLLSEITGSVNGLAVIDLSNYRFGYPARITAITADEVHRVAETQRALEAVDLLRERSEVLARTEAVAQRARRSGGRLKAVRQRVGRDVHEPRLRVERHRRSHAGTTFSRTTHSSLF